MICEYTELNLSKAQAKNFPKKMCICQNKYANI